MTSVIEKNRKGIYAEPDKEVQVGRAETREVGKMGNPSPPSGNLIKNFDSRVDKNKNGRPDRNNSKNVNIRPGKKHGKGQKYGVNCPGRTQKHNPVGSGKHVRAEGKKARDKTAEEIKHQEFLAAYVAFDLDSEKEKPQHIEKKMRNIPMKKHICNKLPNPAHPYQAGNHGESFQQFSLHKPRSQREYNKNSYIDEDNNERGVVKFIAERPPDE
jgi:hypothetical protein